MYTLISRISRVSTIANLTIRLRYFLRDYIRQVFKLTGLLRHFSLGYSGEAFNVITYFTYFPREYSEQTAKVIPHASTIKQVCNVTTPL
jgi:hypothetical protein